MYLLICLFNNIIYMTWDPIFGLHCCEIHMSYLYMCVCVSICSYLDGLNVVKSDSHGND